MDTMNADIFCAVKKSYLERKLMSYDVETFIKQYPDPDTAFRPRTTGVSSMYKQHVRVYLQNKFPSMATEFVDMAMELSGPTLLQTHKHLASVNREDTAACTPSIRPAQPMPAEVDINFYDELLFLLNKEEILGMAEATRASMNDRYDAATAAGELVECVCCLDYTLPEQQTTCPSGHGFCHGCVQRAMEVALGQGKSQLACLHHTCTHNYSISALEQVLKPYTLYSVRRRLREGNRPRARNIEACPYCLCLCDTSEICGDILYCPNAECMRASCRLCRGPNHQQNDQPCPTTGPTDLKAYIANAISEAIVRKCKKCTLPVIKDSGCNRMVCSCGAQFCYLCRKGISGYNHFEKSRCKLFDGLEGFSKSSKEQQEIRHAAQTAMKRYYKSNPRAPKQDIDELLESLTIEDKSETYVERPLPPDQLWPLQLRNGVAQPEFDDFDEEEEEEPEEFHWEAENLGIEADRDIDREEQVNNDDNEQVNNDEQEQDDGGQAQDNDEQEQDNDEQDQYDDEEEDDDDEDYGYYDFE
jgi:hypothetical protein